jgi:hypothetical protein
MLDLLMSIFNVREILDQGLDVSIYFFMGLGGLILFILRLGISLIFGDFDVDFDVDMDIDHDGFGFFSVLSILAFFTGLGWTGVLCRVDLEMEKLPSALIAGVVGFGFMFFAAGLMFFVRKLNKTVNYNPADAIGTTARVYLAIPKRGKGQGQVEVTVTGRRKIMSAVSTGDAIKSFTDVIVTAAEDNDTLVVEPKYKKDDDDSQ